MPNRCEVKKELRNSYMYIGMYICMYVPVCVCVVALWSSDTRFGFEIFALPTEEHYVSRTHIIIGH